MRPLIHSRLNKKFGFIKDSSELYLRIGLADFDCLSQIKLLGDKASDYPVDGYQDPEVLKKVLSNIVSSRLEDVNEKHFQYSDDENAFLESILTFKVNSFYKLVHIYGYILSSRDMKSLSDCISPDCLIFKDDLFAILNKYGFSANKAYEICKRGLWARNEKKKKYVAALAKNKVPTPIIEQFKHTSYLWSKSACIARLQKFYIRD